MKLPLLLSVPHAGLGTPDEVTEITTISPADVRHDGDELAAEIYLPLRDSVEAFVTTEIARAFVDQNRAEDDFRKDGVIKTHTCWDVPIYRRPPTEDQKRDLLDHHYHPYHRRLTELATQGGVTVGVDCHTMAATAPPVAPDPGQPRPAACVSDVDGTSCEPRWTQLLATELEKELSGAVRINDPFRGGFITRSHSAEIPWIQLELSRGGDQSVDAKRQAVVKALAAWSRALPGV